MGGGSRLHTIREAGVALTLTIQGKPYGIHPSLPNVLRFEGQIAEILKAAKGTDTAPPIPEYERDARIAEAAFTHLAGAHAEVIRGLPPPMQSEILTKLWQWFLAKAPTGEVSAPDPTSASGGLPEAVANGLAAYRASVPAPSTAGSAP